jgi:hypothetical protein
MIASTAPSHHPRSRCEVQRRLRSRLLLVANGSEFPWESVGWAPPHARRPQLPHAPEVTPSAELAACAAPSLAQMCAVLAGVKVARPAGRSTLTPAPGPATKDDHEGAARSVPTNQRQTRVPPHVRDLVTGPCTRSSGGGCWSWPGRGEGGLCSSLQPAAKCGYDSSTPTSLVTSPRSWSRERTLSRSR